jgi:hypothetical protein
MKQTLHFRCRWFVAIVLVLSGCTGSHHHYEYPDDTKRAYMAGCEEQPGTTKQKCQCTLDKLSERLTHDEFTKIEEDEEDIVANGKISDNVARVIEECK